MVQLPPVLTNKLQPRGRVLYLGSFLDEAIVVERGLRSHNVAGSNRMKRLAQAMKRAGFRPILLSPATSMRAVRKGGPLLHPARVRRREGVAVVHAPALNVLGLNMLTAPLFQLAVMRRILRRPLTGSIVYNFSPGLLLLTVWLTVISGARLINNVEDIYAPRLADWTGDTEARPVQQLVYWLCMQVVARIADAYLVPTRRFLPYLPKKRAVEVVTGCIAIPPKQERTAPPPLSVLYAGKVEREHGIVQFVEALELLDRVPSAASLRVDICGAGPMTDWVAERLGHLAALSATQHGFVTSEEYDALLSKAHICVALQDPKGRNANFKTPSKLYEFLGHGKAVLATQVGDISEIPDQVLIVLEELSAEQIAEHLSRLAKQPEETMALQAKAREYAIQTFSYETVGRTLAMLMKKAAT